MYDVACFEDFVCGNDYKIRNIRRANASRNSTSENLKFSEIRCVYFAHRKQSFLANQIHERKWFFDK